MSKEYGDVPAFPFVSHGGRAEHQDCYAGMSLRDYFAARAMGELINSYNRNDGGAPFSINSPQEIAGYAYLYADAMMKSRNG